MAEIPTIEVPVQYFDECEQCGYLAPVPAAEVEQAKAGAQALADVRTLDEWAADRERDEGPETASHTTRRPTNPIRGEWVTHLFSGYEGDEDQHDFYGATPDEARAKAAAWVREQAQ